MSRARSKHSADRIVVVESLEKDGEFQTGRILKEDVLDRLGAGPGAPSLDIELRIAESKADLLAILADVETQTQQSRKTPMLHFEIHGLTDGKGFAMLNGDEVHWTELADPLARINHACRNNLILVLATCEGAGLQ